VLANDILDVLPINLKVVAIIEDQLGKQSRMMARFHIQFRGFTQPNHIYKLIEWGRRTICFL